jgi:trans-2,3-dihydro-3-hydroxyanthranilate isomerase
VHGLDAMAKINVNTNAMANLLGEDRRELYVYCRDTQKAESSFHARMFAPLMGVPEDPATGSAAAAFAGVILKYDQPTAGTKNYIIEQGFEMGRPSAIHLELVIDNGGLRIVRIGGYAVQVTKGVIAV